MGSRGPPRALYITCLERSAGKRVAMLRWGPAGAQREGAAKMQLPRRGGRRGALPRAAFLLLFLSTVNGLGSLAFLRCAGGSEAGWGEALDTH